MNANEINEYAIKAYNLATCGGTSDNVSTALLEIAKAGALVSIADSLREMATTQRENQKRDEWTCENVDEYAENGFFICGNCGFGKDDIELTSNYCPDCGARVIGADE